MCRLVAIALASAGIEDGHVAVEFVDAERIAELNAEHRGVDGPDRRPLVPGRRGLERRARPRCASSATSSSARSTPRTSRRRSCTGTLHLVGMDHETDSGEMLALQAEIVSWIK